MNSSDEEKQLELLVSLKDRGRDGRRLRPAPSGPALLLSLGRRGFGRWERGRGEARGGGVRGLCGAGRGLRRGAGGGRCGLGGPRPRLAFGPLRGEKKAGVESGAGTLRHCSSRPPRLSAPVSFACCQVGVE